MRDLDALLEQLDQPQAAPDQPVQGGRDLDALVAQMDQPQGQSAEQSRLPGSLLATAPGVPGAIGRFLEQLSGVQRQFDQGAVSGTMQAVTGLAQLPGVLWNTPGQVWQDVKDLATNPSEAIPTQAKRAGQFAWGMVPMSDTLGRIVAGPPPTAQSVGEDVGRTATSFALPPAVGRVAKSGAKMLVKNMPGAGVALNEMAAERLDQLGQRVTPGRNQVRAAYAASRAAGNPSIAMDNLRRVASDIVNTESSLTKANQNPGLLQLAQGFLDESTQGWDWERAAQEAQRVYAEIKKQRRTYGQPAAELNQLYGAMRDDLANPTPVGQAVQQTATKQAAWETAQGTARRQFAAESLQEQINKAMGVQGEGFDSVSVNRILKWIKQQERGAQLGHPDTAAKRFVESWQPGELQDIKSTLKDISKNLGNIPAIRGTPKGSSERILGGAIGTLGGLAIGGSPFSAGVGTAVGVVTEYTLGRLLVTEAGRAFVRKAMKMAPMTSPQFNQMIGAYLRAHGQGQ